MQTEACNFTKKEIQHRCFPVNFVKFLRTSFFIEHFQWHNFDGFVIQGNTQLYHLFQKNKHFKNTQT